MAYRELPIPSLDALPMGAHRLFMLTDELLYERTGVRIAFTGREGGRSAGPYASLNLATHVGDDPEAVAANRAIVQEALGFAGAPIVVANQVHGTDVVQVGDARDIERAGEEARRGADAIVVGARGVPAIINTADCLPLAIVSPSGAFAVVHAGWRGAVAGIAGKAARMLHDLDGAPAGAFNAYIGPHIRSECFEVGPEVGDEFETVFGDAVVRDARHVSLVDAVTVDLGRAGLDADRIVDCEICTKCHAERYYSYRASGGTCGRQAVVGYALRDRVQSPVPQ